MATIMDVRSAADWRNDQVSDWRVSLSETHRTELLTAMDDPVFPLPTLGPVLAGLSREVLTGKGFALLQGIPVDGLTERQRESLALGIGRHVGGIAPQGPDGVPLLHVRDQGVDPANPATRSYQHSGRLGYHSDPTEMVALLCIRPARSGGLSSIVSSVAVHNEIVRTRPDLAEVLYEPWWRDHRGGEDSFYTSPVYAVGPDGSLTADYGPDYIRSAQRGARVPRLTAAQWEAMELLDELNNDPRFMLTMDLQAGDMQFLNNQVIMHSRTEYEDHPEPSLRRDLIRLWLTREES
jgi:hypothetical protein